MEHVFTVTGMHCGHCEKAITAAVQTLDVQAHTRIDRSANQVTIQSEQSSEVLAQTLRDEGYTVVIGASA